MQIRIKKFFSQKENETIRSFVFRTTQAANLLVSLAISLFIMFIPPCINPIVFGIYFSFSAVISLFFIGTFGIIITNSISQLYQKYQIDSETFLAMNKTKLINQLLELPKKYTLLTFIAFLISGIAATIILNYMLILQVSYFILIWICVAAFPAIINMAITQQICSKIVTEIIAGNFKNDYFNNHLEEKKRLGSSLHFQFFIYEFIPFLITAIISCVLLFYYNSNASIANTVRMILIIATAFCFSIIPEIYFVTKIKNANVFMQDSINFLKDNSKDDSYIPIDYFSELSYIAGNINKISNDYTKKYEAYSQQQQMVINAIEKINSDITQQENGLEIQMILVQEIKTKLDESKSITQAIDDHITENHRIALQTTEHVSFGLNSVRQNITKMKEIIEANKFSVMGIRTLSKEINNIWEIVNMINGIADRTKIIAFNAELEASSLDSENSSFKNVAVNIRTLADKIMDLTKNIRTQILAIQNSSYNLIKRGSLFTEQINDGNNLTLYLESMCKNIQVSAQKSVSFSVDIKNDLEQQHLIRKKLFTEIDTIESTLDKLNESIKENKSVLNEIIEQTKMKSL